MCTVCATGAYVHALNALAETCALCVAQAYRCRLLRSELRHAPRDAPLPLPRGVSAEQVHAIWGRRAQAVRGAIERRGQPRAKAPAGLVNLRREHHHAMPQLAPGPRLHGGLVSGGASSSSSPCGAEAFHSFSVLHPEEGLLAYLLAYLLTCLLAYLLTD